MIKEINSAFLADPWQANETKKIYEGKSGFVRIPLTVVANILSAPAQFIAGTLGLGAGIIGGGYSTIKNLSFKNTLSTGFSCAEKTAKITAVVASTVLLFLTIPSYACARLASQSAWARSELGLVSFIQARAEQVAREIQKILKLLIKHLKMRLYLF